ncbi:IS3 family transposase [Streptomyces sp. NPDC057910]|uniref:IS3 family transposase n=1 Tax=Streptomyces sp. NPDC057910 TaxID=3346278 RepID=UPI0036E7B34B
MNVDLPFSFLIGRDFTADQPGTGLAGDITYLPTLAGWWYPATVIDLATHEVIGYAMADHHRAELVVDALTMAGLRGGLKPGCIMHSDRGREYTRGEFRRQIRKLNLRQSMGRTGSCYDNAAAESFFGLLKAEIGTTVWESHETARTDILRFIEAEYNRTRLRKHPEYGYVTPLETRTLLQPDLALAAQPPAVQVQGGTSGELQGSARQAAVNASTGRNPQGGASRGMPTEVD